MADPRFDRLLELFEQAATLRLAERQQFLDSLKEEDSQLRSELLDLLSGHEQTVGLLERPQDLEPLLDEEAEGREHEKVGDWIGPYRLEEELGKGGMGRVFLAHQEEPLRRDVALKLIRTGLDSHEVLARFRAERQALALMDHPAIARVFDAGTTPSGRPFFVMELQAGSPITRYCDEQRLSIEERLRLFGVVCEAVQHAHRRGIIHRDLKPSNVLVSEVDGVAVPKVIDFGIAKAIDHGPVEPSLTTDRQLLGTPEYMSPEQWDAGGDIDTRTDVYSLGVLLYRLLVGSLPFERSEGEGLGGLLRDMATGETPRPSTRLSSLGERGEKVAELRGTDLGTLRRRLAGELDWIVLKAMARDREKRYGSAAELAAELGRYLRHEALVAGPPGTLYRLRKAARRHRGKLLAVAAVFVALVVGLASTVVALREARRSQAQAEEQATIAEEQAAIAEAVNRFLNQDLLGAAAPQRAGDRETTVREVLDLAAARLESGFDGPPSVEAEIRDTLGTAYFKLGEYRQARNMEAAGYDLRRWALGPEHPDTIHSALELAASERKLQRLDRAEQLLSEALPLAERTLGADHPTTLGGLHALAFLHQERGNLERAASLYLEVLERQRRVEGERSEDVAKALNNLANVVSELGRNDEAIDYGNQSLELFRDLRGEEHLSTVEVAANLAGNYITAQRYAEGVTLLRETIATMDRILGPDHASTVQQRLNLANGLGRLGNYDEAVSLARQSWQGFSRALGPNHARTLAALRALAVNLDRQGRSSEAAPLFAEAVAAGRRHLGEDHWYTGVFLSQYGRCLVNLERYEEAEAALLQGFQILEVAFDEEHLQVTESIERLVLLYDRWGRPGEAAAWRAKLAHGADQSHEPPVSQPSVKIFDGTDPASSAPRSQMPLRGARR